MTKPTSGVAAQGVQSKSVVNGAAAEAEWEQFQAFVAQVEQADEEKDDEGREALTGGDEEAAREAEASLENMQYLDRYRQALEHASAPQASGGDASTSSERKRERQASEDEKEDAEEDLTAVVREAAAEAAKRRRVAPAEVSDDDDAEDDDSSDDSENLEDLLNWRSKGI